MPAVRLRSNPLPLNQQLVPGVVGPSFWRILSQLCAAGVPAAKSLDTQRHHPRVGRRHCGVRGWGACCLPTPWMREAGVKVPQVAGHQGLWGSALVGSLWVWRVGLQ